MFLITVFSWGIAAFVSRSLSLQWLVQQHCRPNAAAISLPLCVCNESVLISCVLISRKTVIYPQIALLQGDIKCELLDAKHESHLLHLDGQLSYDPKPYGVDHATRFHIKTMQVSSQWFFLQFLQQDVIQQQTAFIAWTLYPIVLVTCLSLLFTFSISSQHQCSSCCFTPAAAVKSAANLCMHKTNSLQDANLCELLCSCEQSVSLSCTAVSAMWCAVLVSWQQQASLGLLFPLSGLLPLSLQHSCGMLQRVCWVCHLTKLFTLQVYRHHCVSALSAKHQRWRDCALYIVKHINAVKWALDLCGFRNVAIPVHSMQVNSSTDGAQSAVLVNIRFSVQLAIWAKSCQAWMHEMSAVASSSKCTDRRHHQDLQDRLVNSVNEAMSMGWQENLYTLLASVLCWLCVYCNSGRALMPAVIWWLFFASEYIVSSVVCVNFCKLSGWYTSSRFCMVRSFTDLIIYGNLHLSASL